MSFGIEVTPVPLHGPAPWLSYRRDLLRAPDEPAGPGIGPSDRDRILIIEDDLLVASQIQAALTEAGFEVVGAVTTGEEAIELASAEPPALAVIDIKLAGDRDGVDTAIELFRTHGIRCIFASAYSDREARRRAEPAAPVGWLQKPYTMTSLTELVRSALRELRAKK